MIKMFFMCRTYFCIAWFKCRIRELTSQKIGTLLRISGQVVRTHPVHPELVSGTFICLDCQTVIKDVEQQFKYTQVCVWFFAFLLNRPFPNYLLPLFQNEAWCSTIHMKMSLICMWAKTYNHLKGWALGLALKMRPKVIQKWTTD